MAHPRTPVAGRYAFAGLLKNTQGVDRWIGLEQDSARRVVLLAADAGRLTTLDSARGVKHRHLTSVIDVVRDVPASSLPSGQPLPEGSGVAIAEFVPGTTLHGELSRGGMNSSKAVAWTLRLAEALSALHSAGAVHGALSPRSVIAVPAGRAIAPVLSQLVAPALGAYCPPERLKGSLETAPDDVWALHATLYAALTRQAPYSAPTRDALLKQMLSGRPRPLSAFGIDEPALQEILDRGLAYERRVRVTELPELIATLDAWERDPRAMPGKRQVPPRPAPRSLTDIVGTSQSKGRDDGIVIDGSTLPDDEGSELSPKPAPPATVPPPAPPLVPSATPLQSAAAASVLPVPVARETLGSGPNLAATVSVLPTGQPALLVPLARRISINPFERKRSVWPLVVLAALLGGGGVYLAVAPDAPPPEAKPEPVAAVIPPKVTPPGRPKLSPGQARDACVASYFDPGTFAAAQNFEFVCGDTDFRDLATQLQRLAHAPANAQPGAAPATETARGDAGARSSGLDWYELPAAAIIRKSCCDGATPVILPESTSYCEQLQAVVRRIADDSNKAGDLAPDARGFDKAVSCLFVNKGSRIYVYDKAPNEANRQAFQQFLSRAAISEARR